MLRIIQHPLSLLLLAVLLAACGAQQRETLEAKQAKLVELNNQMTQLKRQIQEVESEIEAMDPSRASKARETTVEVAELSPKTFQHYVEVQGTVEANKNVVVSPQASGAIMAIPVKEGQNVRAGQLLARVDDAIMKASLEEVKTSLELANIMFEKQKNLWDQEIGTEVQYLQAKNQKEGLERKLKTLEEQLEKTNVRAPISGTIDEVMIKVGETVSPGYPSFRLVSSRDLSLKANLSEAYVADVKAGDPVKVYFPVLDREMDARVSVVGQSIHPVDRTFEVEVNLPNDPSFKANMYGRLSVNDQTIEETLTVPLNVIQRSENGSFVFVAEQQDGKWVAQRRFIDTGLTYNGQVQVKKGLKAGEQLITMGGNTLSDGQLIELVQ